MASTLIGKSRPWTTASPRNNKNFLVSRTAKQAEDNKHEAVMTED